MQRRNNATNIKAAMAVFRGLLRGNFSLRVEFCYQQHNAESAKRLRRTLHYAGRVSSSHAALWSADKVVVCGIPCVARVSSPVCVPRHFCRTVAKSTRGQAKSLPKSPGPEK